MNPGPPRGEARQPEAGEPPTSAGNLSIALHPSAIGARSRADRRVGRLQLPIVMMGAGALTVAVFGASLTELRILPRPSALTATLSGIGLLAALISAAFLLWGVQRRTQLIYELHQSVLDVAYQVGARDRRWSVDDNGDWLIRIPDHEGPAAREEPQAEPDGLTRNELLDLLEEYELSLSRLGAFAEARETRALVSALRDRYAGDSKVIRGNWV